MIPEPLRKSLVNQHYKIIGNHSAVKLCGWLKRSLKDQGYCYKQKFYGIQSHRCLQMTPWLACSNRCVYCWRIIEKLNIKPEEIDEPETIIEGSVQAQRELISGFKGYEGTNLKKWKEAKNPNQAAISLVGEPTMYPKIPDLIKEFHRRGFTTFLVTNGLFPERLENLEAPTNLYISLDAPDPETYERIDRPKLKDYWERLLRSLEIMNSFRTRRVIRLTMVREWNMHSPEKYAKLIEKANPDFIEVKGYMWVGESRKRLPSEAMPSHKEIQEFADKLSKETGYVQKDEQEESRVVLLSKV